MGAHGPHGRLPTPSASASLDLTAEEIVTLDKASEPFTK